MRKLKLNKTISIFDGSAISCGLFSMKTFHRFTSCSDGSIMGYYLWKLYLSLRLFEITIVVFPKWKSSAQSKLTICNSGTTGGLALSELLGDNCDKPRSDGNATTNSVRVTSDVPPDSRGIGCNRKCSSMSNTDWNHKCCTLHWPSGLRVILRCYSQKSTCKYYCYYPSGVHFGVIFLLKFTLAFPWKLNVRTNSPILVSLWRTKKVPWPSASSCNTSRAASDLDRVPWNHGYSCKVE